ncbi:syntaphilin isoform X2 [Pseudorasbora parva]|uniref:syntaphilin isoform X2 n=1 Tax=Pseudorasbora parva TaxID=51549 RepID=UPI00351E692D
MSLPANRKTSAGSRRSAAPSSTRHSHGDSTVRSSYSTASCKCTESSTVPRSNPATPRRQAQYATCSENHGIRPPAPEQYLTPLQQKEVCIRHLRARLKENVERLQDRDSEIEELRIQLTRMQEDWIEEECHRVEAQLALKKARKEIQQLQQAVDTVRSNLGVHEEDQQDCKSEGLGVGRVGLRFGASRSCGCSPAHTMSRSATFTRLSSDTSPGATDRNGKLCSDRYIPANRGAMTLPRGDGRTHLLLEAALLSEQVPHTTLCSTLSRSSTCERLCSGETVLPVSRSCHAVNNNCSCGPHTYLPHHHLFLHLPQEEAPPPPPPPPPPPTAPPSASEVSDRPGYRSQACSPTITWISEEGGEELSVITSATCAPDLTLAEPQVFSPSSATASPAQMSWITETFPLDSTIEFTSSTVTPTMLTNPQVQQPCPRASPPLELPPQETTIVKVNDEDGVEEDEGSAPPQRSHWSRYFLIDLLAVAVPVVPTLAWLCRGPRNEGMPMYNMSSLLRGCCAVALHSLRRVGSGCGRSPSGTGRATPI